MNCRKFYIFILVSMTLLAALGFWAMIDGAYKWEHRPRIEVHAGQEKMAFLAPGDFVNIT